MKNTTAYLFGALSLLVFNLQASDGQNQLRAKQVKPLTITVNTKQTFTFAPHRLIVQFKKDQSLNTLSFQSKSISKNSRVLGKMHNGERISVVKIPKNMNLDTALKTYQADPNVRAVSYDYYNHLYFTPNDAIYAATPNVMWGLKDTAPDLAQPGILPGRPSPNSNDTTIDNDISAEKAWDIWNPLSPAVKANVVVAVIDSGVDYTHPDLAKAMWDGINATIAGVPSATANFGRNVADAINDPYPVNALHGTHVSGTIAASGNNRIGMLGVAYGVKIMAIKVDNNSDGSISDSSLIAGINYAAENGADIINMSLGRGGPESSVLTGVIENAINAGVLIVAAAGNDAEDNDIVTSWPANYANIASTRAGVVSVAATDQADQLALFSNFGANSVTLSAPGVNIKSTVSGQETLPENIEIGSAFLPGDGSGLGLFPFCRDNPISCFDQTLFANPDPAGSDCSGLQCQWGWVKSSNPNASSLIILGDDNQIPSNIPDRFNYTNNMNGTITSKVINVPRNSKAILSYFTLWDLECGNGNADYIDVEAFDGTNWNLLPGSPQFNLDLPVVLNGRLNLCQSNHTITGHMALFPAGPNGIQGINIRHDLSAYTNPNLKIRFRFVTNASVNETQTEYGFKMTNVRIITQVNDYTNSYAFLNGTSMASPHIAGVAALIKGVNPSFTPAQIKTTLENTGDSLPSLIGKTTTGTRVNAFNAINIGLTPQPPVITQIGNKEIEVGSTLNFTVMSSDLNGTIPNLTIQGKPNAATFTLANPNDGSGQFSWTPSNADIGTRQVTFTANDNDPATQSSSETITISVKSVVIVQQDQVNNSSSGGGCTVNKTAKFDPLMLLFLLLSIIFIVRKKLTNSH